MLNNRLSAAIAHAAPYVNFLKQMGAVTLAYSNVSFQIELLVRKIKCTAVIVSPN